MSISNLLVPNNYHLQGQSFTSAESFSNIPTASSQTLSVVAATQILFPTVLVPNANGNYSVSTSTYTNPEAGYYHFYTAVNLVFTVTTADSVAVSISIMDGSTPLQTSFYTIDLANSGNAAITIPVAWYGYLNASQAITVQSDIPISLSHGSGNFTLYEATQGGTIFYGNQG